MQVFLRSMEITNFKSFEKSKITVAPLNVVVGPNGSGKTNLLESFKLAFDCVNYSGPTDYPFVPFWGYNNAVHGMEQTKNMSFNFELQLNEYRLFYEQTVSGAGGSLSFLEEKIRIKNYVEIKREGAFLTIKYDPKFFQELQKDSTLVKHVRNEVREAKSSVEGKKGRPTFDIEQRFDMLDETRSIISQGLSNSYFDYVTRKARDYDVEILNLGPRRRYREGVPIVSPIITEISGERQLKISLLEALFEFFGKRQSFSRFNHYSVVNPSNRRIILLKHNFIYGMKNPVPLNYNPEGVVNGEWTVAWLYKRFNERSVLFENIQNSIEDLFKGWKIGFKLTDEGNIILKVNDQSVPEKAIELLPPSLPDGFFKALLVLTSLEMNPSILMVDELENSLHDKMVQYLIDTIKDSEINSIITTHSPLVVNSADLGEIRILEKINGNSTIKSIPKPEETRKKLIELGITPSESWLYGEFA